MPLVIGPQGECGICYLTAHTTEEHALLPKRCACCWQSGHYTHRNPACLRFVGYDVGVKDETDCGAESCPWRYDLSEVVLLPL